MNWQERVRGRVKALGLHVTSGYRTVAAEQALGGSASSWHCHGTVTEPGAMDVGGPATRLSGFFDELAHEYHGRINELFLNIPGGRAAAIKDDRPLAHNPEAGHPKHLHIALRD